MVKKYQLKSRTQAKRGFSAKRVHLKTTGRQMALQTCLLESTTNHEVRDMRSSTFATTTAVIPVERRTR